MPATTTKRPLSPAKIQERDVTRTVRDFLVAHGWRAIRMQRSIVPGAYQTGEPGMPDYLFLHYFPRDNMACGTALHLWIEFKRAGDRRKCRCLANQGTRKRCTVCDQKNWGETEVRRGGVLWRVADIPWFEEVYFKYFGWLHSGESARGQLDLLAAVRGC